VKARARLGLAHHGSTDVDDISASVGMRPMPGGDRAHTVRPLPEVPRRLRSLIQVFPEVVVF